MSLYEQVKKNASKYQRTSQISKILKLPEVIETIKKLRNDGYSYKAIASGLNDTFRSKLKEEQVRVPKGILKFQPKGAKEENGMYVYSKVPEFTSQKVKRVLETI